MYQTVTRWSQAFTVYTFQKILLENPQSELLLPPDICSTKTNARSCNLKSLTLLLLLPCGLVVRMGNNRRATLLPITYKISTINSFPPRKPFEIVNYITEI